MTREQIELMTGTQLVAAFNSLPGVKQVKRFASQADGVKRLTAALAQAAPAKPAGKKSAKAAPPPAPEPEHAVPPKAKPTPAPAKATAPAKQQKAAEAPAPVAARSYPAGPAGKLPRPGTKRDQLLGLLRQPAGLTVEEICQRFEWKANDAKDALYLLAKKNGVPVACGADGRWRAK